MSSADAEDGHGADATAAKADVRADERPTIDSTDRRFSPGRMLVSLILAIFVAEFLVMVGLHVAIRDLPPGTVALVDSTVLVLLVFPVLYVALFRPMNRTIDQLQTQRESLQNFRRTVDQTEQQRNNLEVLNEVLRHDVRNDLQLVAAYADMIEEHVETEEGEKYLQTITESTADAIALTETAGDLADVMLHPHSENEPVRIDGVIEEEVAQVRETNSDVELRLEDPLPDVTVRADSLLNSVFRNLLSNAIRHNDKATPRITVSAAEENGLVRVRVADNGPGVPDGRKDDVFGRGEQGLESAGSGMGLYLVSTLVDSYGGDVRVEDNDPEGVVFVVELPVGE